MANLPSLTPPQLGKELVIYTDASDTGIGGVIEQDGTPILYHSRLLSDSELNYSVTEKEYFAIYEILWKYRELLFGSPITIFTDHQAIVGLNPENHNPRVARWWERINYFTPRIKWLKGEDNEVADACNKLIN